MLGFRLDKPVRVACGLGLLLLLAAQEKVCPWLVTPPQQPGKPQTDASKKDGKKTPGKTLLPYVLPDASAPRWSATWNHATLRAAAGAHDGVVSCGRENPAQQPSLSAYRSDSQRYAWHCFLSENGLESCIAPPAESDAAVDPALGTAIWPAAPPPCQA